jgi:hypothetical protein
MVQESVRSCRKFLEGLGRSRKVEDSSGRLRKG